MSDGNASVVKEANGAAVLLIAGISKGNEFVIYEREGEVDSKKNVFVFFDKNDGEDGTVYWCEPGKKEKSNSLELENVTDVFMGKDTDIFGSAIAEDLDEDTCFSLVSDDFELNLVAAEEDIVDTWVEALTALLAGEGTSDSDADSDADEEPKQSTAALRLAEGSEVTRYSGDGKETVFLFFKPNEDTVGTFYWNGPDATRFDEDVDTSIPLADVTDIVIGTQTSAFETEEGKNANAAFCFSIVSKTGSLSVECSDEETLQFWIQGVSGILSQTGGSVTIDEDDNEDETETKSDDAVTSFAVDANPAASVEEAQEAAKVEAEDAADDAEKESKAAETAVDDEVVTKPLTPSLKDKDAIIEMMQEGREFKRITQDGIENVLVFWEGELGQTGTLYFSAPGRKVTSKESSIPVKSLSEIMVGRQAKVFKTPHGKHCGSGKCVSFISKKVALHLEAQTKEQVQAWIAGIKTIVTSTGKAVVEDAADSTAAAAQPVKGNLKKKKQRKFSIMPGAKEAKVVNKADFLTAGVTFKSVIRSRGQIVLEEIVLTLDQSDPAVPTFTDAEGNINLPVRKLTDIFCGKTTAELKSDVASDFDKRSCFTLVTKSVSLHLIADNAKVVNQFIDGIKAVIMGQGKAVVMDGGKKKGNRRYSVLASRADAAKQAPITAKMTIAAITTMMRKGRAVTSYAKNKSGFVKKSKKLLFFADGSFFWSDLSARSKATQTSVPLRKISDVFIGKQTDELKSNVAGPANAKACMSIVSKNAAIHMEFSTPKEVTAWLDGIKHLVATSGKKIVEAGSSDVSETKTSSKSINQSTGKKTNRRFSVLDSKKAHSKGDPRTIMKNGEVFVSLFKNPKNPKEIASKRITLFIDLNTKVFYWCAPGRKIKDQANSLPLSQVTDIYVGKQTAELQQEVVADIPKRNCFSIIGKNNSLHLYATDKIAVNRWLKGIEAIIKGQGKEMVVDTESGKKKKGSRRFSVMAKSGLKDQPVVRKVPEPEDCLKLFAKGRKVKSYKEVAGKITGELITLFYSESKSAFFFSAKGKVEEEKQSIPLRSITDIYLGKQTVELKSAAAASVKKAAALSIISADVKLYLELSSGNEVKALIECIKYCVQNQGNKLVDEGDSSGNKSKGRGAARRFSVAANTTLGGQATISKKLSVAECIHLIRSGRNFNLYKKSNVTGKVSKKSIFLFFSLSKQTFSWWGLDEKKKNPDAAQDPANNMQLKHVTDIFVGKQTMELKSALAANVSRNLCWSLTGKKGRRLNLEAQSPIEVKNWLKGISAVIKQTGKVLADDSSKKHKKGKAGRRFSVMAGAKTFEAKTLTEVPAADECVELMRKGFKVTTFSKNGGEFAKKSSTAFYSRDDNSIHWCDSKGDRVKVSGQSIAVPQITDIFMGKQTDALKSNAARLADASKCITIQSRSGLELNMETPSDIVKQLWLDGIVFIVKNVEGKAVVEDRPAAKVNSSKRRFSVLQKPSDGQQPITKVLKGPEAIRTLMRKGRECKKYSKTSSGAVSTKKVVLFYSAAGKTLYWCKPGQRDQNDDASLPLNTVTDIFMGKSSEELKSKTAAKAASVCCLCVVGKTTSISVEFDTAAEVKSWIEGLKTAIIGNGKRIEEDETVSKQNKRRYSIMAGGKTTQSAITSVLTGAKALKFMRDGRIFTSIEKSSSGSFAGHKLFLYYSTAQKTFFWCEPGERTQSYDRAVPLQQITDIYLGKQTKHFQGAAGSTLDAKSCFSILSKTHGLHLCASSNEEVMSWLEGVKTAVSASGKKTVNDDSRGKGKRRMSVLTGAKAKVNTTAPVTKKLSVEKAIDLMTGGRDVTLYNKGEEPKGACLFYAGNTLYWSPPGINKRVRSTNSLPLSQLTDIYLKGLKDTFPEANDEAIRLSLLGKNGAQVNLEFSSAFEKDAWFNGIRHIISSGGNRVVEDEPVEAKKAKGKRRFSVMSTASSAKAKPEDAVKAITQGANFYMYVKQSGVVKRKRVFLFYDNSEIAAGAIYWCARGKREISETRVLNIKKLTAIMVGKHTSILKSVSDLQAELCFSLQTRRINLDLEGTGKNTITTWLKAIQFLVAATGRGTVVEDSKGASGLKKSRKFSILGKVPMKEAKTKKTVDKSSSEKDTIEKAMRHGQSFKFVTTLDAQDATVYYKSGAFYVCLEDQSFKTAEVVMAIKSLTDIYVGKQSSTFKNNAMCADFTKGQCFTLASADVKLNLVAADKQQINNWLAGIKHILSKNTSKKMFMAAGAQGKKGSRRYSVMKKVGLSIEKKSAGFAADLSLTTLEEGITVTAFGNVQAPKKETVDLFYVSTVGKKGTLFWGAVGQRSQATNNKLLLTEITDIYLGTQTEIWTKSVASGVNSKACLSVVGKSNILNIECASPEDQRNALNAITSILNKQAGKNIVENNAASSKKGQRRFSVLPTKSAGGNTKAPKQVLSDFAKKPNAMLAEDVSDAMEVMEQGRRFFLYHESSPTIWDRKEVTVFYSRTDGKLGTLYYCAPGKRVKDPFAAIPLNAITDLYYGKKTEGLKSVAASRANAKHCVAFSTNKTEINLEAKSAGQLSTYLFAITHTLLAKTNKAGKKSGAKSNKAVVAAKQYSAEITALIKGAKFTKYAEADNADDSTESVVVKYVPGENMGQFVVEGASGTETLALLELSTVLEGKESPVLQLPFAADASEDSCFSIVLDDGSSLDLEAISKRTRDKWLTGIASIFADSDDAEVEVELAEETTSKKKGRRMSVAPKGGKAKAKKTKRVIAATNKASALKEENILESKSVAGPAADKEAVLAIQAGAIFTGFAQNREGKYVKKAINLFYEQDGKTGTLYWSSAAARVKSQACSLPLRQITEILVGKHSTVLRSNIADNSPDELCFTLVTPNVAIDLEAPNTQTLNNWLYGIQGALSEGGYRVLADTTNRRFTVSEGTRTTASNHAGFWVGFIGLDGVGHHIARHTAQAKVSTTNPITKVQVWSKSSDVAQQHEVKFGSSSVKKLSMAACDVIFTCLDNSDEVDDVITKLAPHLSPQTIVVDVTASADPSKTKQLGAQLALRGVTLLDAPLDGDRDAKLGQLNAVVGGPFLAFQMVYPILARFCGSITHVGQLGAAQAVKAVEAALTVAHLVAAAEGLATLTKFGVDARVALSAINSGSGRSYVTKRVLPEFVLSRAFDSGVSLGSLNNGVSVATTMLNRFNPEASVLTQTRAVVAKATREYGAEGDYTQIAKLIEESSKADLR